MTHVTPRTTNSPYDAIVVGARCAGAATAMLLARQGLKVLVVDRGRYGSDTLSTHALMRGGVVQLQRWGVLDRLIELETPTVRRTTFHYGDETIDIPIKPRGGLQGLYAPRRSVLDALLVDAALEAGAEVLHGVCMVDLVRSSASVVSGVVLRDSSGETHEVRAEIVIGADGRGSAVARAVGAESYRLGRYASGVIYGYWNGLGLGEGYHWYYGPGVSAGFIPTNGGATCLFASMPSARMTEEFRADVDEGYRVVLRECSPDLLSSLAGGQRAGNYYTFAGQVGFLRQSWGRGWALVGDAGYFKDPITAHGMTDALRDAELLARAVVRGSEQALADYQAIRDEYSHELFEVTDAIASYTWDLAAVKRLHLQLSEAMKREVKMLAQLDSPMRRTA